MLYLKSFRLYVACIILTPRRKLGMLASFGGCGVELKPWKMSSQSLITWSQPLQTGYWLSWSFLAFCCCCCSSESAGASAVRTRAAATSAAPAAPNAAAVLEHVSSEKRSGCDYTATCHRCRQSFVMIWVIAVVCSSLSLQLCHAYVGFLCELLL